MQIALLIGLFITNLIVLGWVDISTRKIDEKLDKMLFLSIPEVNQSIPVTEAIKVLIANQKMIFQKLEEAHKDIRLTNQNLLAPTINPAP